MYAGRIIFFSPLLVWIDLRVIGVILLSKGLFTRLRLITGINSFVLMHAFEHRCYNLIIRIGLFSRCEEPSLKKSNIHLEISSIFEEAICEFGNNKHRFKFTQIYIYLASIPISPTTNVNVHSNEGLYDWRRAIHLS